MRHRHIDEPPGELSVTAVESIFERGGASDIVGLLRLIRADPGGPASEAVLRACRHSEVYGYPRLFEACIHRWRQEAAGDGQCRQVSTDLAPRIAST
jgi:hypothetical protein